MTNMMNMEKHGKIYMNLHKVGKKTGKQYTNDYNNVNEKNNQ